MASRLFAILLILPAIYAKIQIDVVASVNEAERSANAFGSTVDIISDVERGTYRITDGNLKYAVGQFFGQEPDDAFVRSPTPWGDLYLTYNWREVSRTLRTQGAKILEVTSHDSVLFTNGYINNSTMTINFTVVMNQNVRNSLNSLWQVDGELTVGQEISYNLKTVTTGVSGNTTFSYTSKWGESLLRFETVSVGSLSELRIPVEPFSSIRAELHVTRSRMKIQVDYEATLFGQTAVNYAKTFKCHHFWALGINSVIKAGGVDPVVRSRELLDLDYYSNSIVRIVDSNSNEILYSIPV